MKRELCNGPDMVWNNMAWHSTAFITSILTLVFPDPVGPTIIKPCRTTVVSYN